MSNDHVDARSTPTGVTCNVVPVIVLTDTGKPIEPTQEPEHDLHGFCWCQPLVETDVVSGSRLYIHRRSLDSPHIEHA